jgi:hypothetical protein
LKRYLAEYNVNLTTFPKCVQDGKILLYLLHKREHSLVNLDEMESKSASDRLLFAFDCAERALSIPHLLDPQDVLENPDEQSILTYISYFKSHLNRPVNLAADSRLQAEMEDLRRQFEEEASTYKQDLKKQLQSAEHTKAELEKLQMELERANRDKQMEAERQKKIEEEVLQLKQSTLSIECNLFQLDMMEKEKDIKEAYADLKTKHKQCNQKIKALKSEKEQAEFELEEVWKKLKDEKNARTLAEDQKKAIEGDMEQLAAKSKSDASRVVALQGQVLQLIITIVDIILD